MDVLPIQGSAVPCERVFSSAKETMTARRNRISPVLMEALQIIKFSIKKGHKLTFTSSFDSRVQLDELESWNTAEQCVPEDVHSFVESLLQDIPM